MRLLNVETESLQEFGDHPPPYSILSHTWGDEEVTLDDIKSNNYTHLQGYQKIRGLCKVSRAEGYLYTWIDTCCLDKTSSSELSEAVNSMFNWYRLAAVCFAYLEDVHGYPGRGHSGLDQFKRSRWFTRGWTLQELIVPRMVILLNSNWREIGTKSAPYWARLISEITGVDRNCLAVSTPYSSTTEILRTYSVAQKMSWAAKRTTTRPEDKAYSIMGLFEVNMPVLYGEGDGSFARLQREILNISNDASIFVWQLSTPDVRPRTQYGILAPSIECFAGQGMVHKLKHNANVDSHNVSPDTVCRPHKSTVLLRVCVLGNLEPWESLPKMQKQHFESLLASSSDGSSSRLRNGYFPSPQKAVVMLDCATTKCRVGFTVQADEYGSLWRSDPTQLLNCMGTESNLPPADYLLFNLQQNTLPDEQEEQSYCLDFEESLSQWGYTCAEGTCVDQQTRADLRSQYCGKHWRLFTPSGHTDGYPSILVVFCHTLGKAPQQLRRDTVFVGCEVFARSFIDQSNVGPLINRVQLTSLHDTTEIRYKAFPTKHLVIKLRVAIPRLNTLVASLQDVDDDEPFDANSGHETNEVDDAASIATTLVEYRDWVFG